jgi:hypothetical protein
MISVAWWARIPKWISFFCNPSRGESEGQWGVFVDTRTAKLSILGLSSLAVEGFLLMEGSGDMCPVLEALAMTKFSKQKPVAFFFAAPRRCQ